MIYISYSWVKHSKEFVDVLDNALEQNGISIIRDKRNLKYRGSIEKFMKDIGTAKAIIVVVCDKYLKSHYCMFELYEIFRNLNFANRVYPIFLKDTNIFSPKAKLKYLEYWKKKQKELENEILKYGENAIRMLGAEYDIYRKIFDNFPEIINTLADMNALNETTHTESNFESLIEALKENPQNMSPYEAPIAEPLKVGNKQLVTNLIDEYQRLLILSTDPKQRFFYEDEIARLKKLL